MNCDHQEMLRGHLFFLSSIAAGLTVALAAASAVALLRSPARRMADADDVVRRSCSRDLPSRSPASPKSLPW
jgi:hypothetical protein